ncbi:MAG: L,D-transpeptidase family protein [Thiohalocapsa sp.]|jgi:lipoprotein-anchoring transpeptidase ErfK/SrfK|nr:L,D-transpeptidase family protein [Thiohalocapsa sp.]
MTAARIPFSSSHLTRASVLAIWLLSAGGCAQITFPELPSGLFARPAPEASEQKAADKEAAAADKAAETAEPAEADRAKEAAKVRKPGKLYEWDGDGQALTRIVIDTNEQTATFYAGDQRVGWSTIASGVPSHPTPRGEFTILEKARDKRSNLYGKIVGRNGRVIRGSADGNDPVPHGARFVGASMPNFMRLTYDGIGMHAGPIPRPGHPASHGCIRMPPKIAAAVYAHTSPGTAVTVVGKGPNYGNYAERVARQQAEERARRAAAAAAQKGTALDALDAEIEVMQDADVGSTGAAASAGGSKPGSATTEASAAEAGKQAAGAKESAAGPKSRGNASGSGSAPARPAETAPEATRTDTQPGEAAASGGDGASATAPADAGAAATQPGSGSRQEQPVAPDAEPATTPESAPAQPAESAEPHPYYPPAPPPTIRSAGSAPNHAEDA